MEILGRLLYFAMYHVHFAPDIEGKNKDVHNTWVVLLLYQY